MYSLEFNIITLFSVVTPYYIGVRVTRGSNKVQISRVRDKVRHKVRDKIECEISYNGTWKWTQITLENQGKLREFESWDLVATLII